MCLLRGTDWVFTCNSAKSSSKVKELNLNRKDQYGFKRGHCTTHALLRLIEGITQGFNNNKATIVPFLDIETAFYKVWVTGVISKLITAAIPAHFSPILHCYLNNKSFTAVHGKAEFLSPADSPS